MNIEELNNFIKEYADTKLVKSAIMISAPWGTGKSYYINKSLVPFLKNECNIETIVVSLYGLSELDEISKNIFLELKASFFKKQNPYIVGSKIIGKTILNGLVSFFGIDFKLNENDFKEIYKSIDLTNKVIILDDVERTSIDVIKLLGFVNNLVEQDGAKVILVTNEEELTKRHSFDKWDYFNIKEKTISDTIQFHLPPKNAIEKIIDSFSFDFLNDRNRNILLDEIEKIMIDITCSNLRSIIFASQKTKDILTKFNFETNNEFKLRLFLSNIAFCLKRKHDDSIIWASNDLLSPTLGTSKYPLYKFAYDYLIYQYLDLPIAKNAYDVFCDTMSKETIKNELRPILNVIYSYYLHTEKDVKEAVKLIQQKISIGNDIPYTEYIKLANYLIAIKYDISDCADEIESCKEVMIANISNATSSDFETLRFSDSLTMESIDALKEFKDFKTELFERSKTNNKKLFNFNYSLEGIEKFCDQIYKNKDNFITERCFAQKIDNEKFVELLSRCNPYEMDSLRAIFHYVYSFQNIKDYFYEDKESLTDLKSRVENLESKNSNFDLMQRKQLKYLISNLNDILFLLN